MAVKCRRTIFGSGVMKVSEKMILKICLTSYLVHRVRKFQHKEQVKCIVWTAGGKGLQLF